MPGKTQDQLDQARDQAALRAKTAVEDAKRASDDEDIAVVETIQTAQLLESAEELVELRREEHREAQNALPKDTREDVIEAARQSQIDVDDDEKPNPFTDEDAQRIGAAFDKELREAQARIERAAKALSGAQSEQKDALEKDEAAQRKLASARSVAEDAEEKRIKAVAEAAIAAELSHQGTKKKVRWLAWDGTLGVGTCNTLPPDPTTPAAVARAAYANRKTVLNVPTTIGTSVSATLSTPTTVSVRIVSCSAGPFLPADDHRATVEVELKRMFRIQSLLFRVLDQHGVAVYQEELDAGQIDALPETQGAAAPAKVLVPFVHPGDVARHAFEEKQRRLRAVPATGLARPDAGPFKFRVWVSDQPNAFNAITLADEPVETYGAQVHDQSVRVNPKHGQSPLEHKTKNDKVGRNAAGINQTQVKKTRLIHMAIQAVESKHASTSAGQTATQKINALQASLVAANTHFGPARPHELRLLMGPEWYFQKSAEPWTHTPAEKATIVQDLINLSGTPAAQDWLLVPGTILYGEPLATTGAEAVFNLMPIVSNGVLVHEYFKRQWGSDTQDDATARRQPTDPAWSSIGFEEKAKGNEKRAKKLDAHTFPPSLAAPMRARWGTTSGLTDKSVPSGAKPQWVVQASGDRFAVWKPGKKLLRLCRKELFATAIEDDTAWGEWIGNGLLRADYIKSNFFQHSGLKLALEICADHGGGRAAGEYQATDGHALPNHDSGVDIHLVSAVGVRSYPWKVVARTGGIYSYLNGEAGQCFSVEVTARATPITTVQTLALNSWATKQVGAFAPAVSPPGTPVTLTPSNATTAMLADGGIPKLKYTSHLLEEV